MMKACRSRFQLGTLGLLFAACAVSTVRAGSAVATDDHGGYGYAHGDRPVESLRREARHRCMDKSKYPDDVHVVVSTESHGAGIILRYRANGGQHIYAYVGADSASEAYRYAADGVREKDGHDIEVVARWND